VVLGVSSGEGAQEEVRVRVKFKGVVPSKVFVCSEVGYVFEFKLVGT
jgi:hypothetical protein